jgi:hypothetical protein
MSIDAMALLRIKKLELPRASRGFALGVAHRGDASVVSTFVRYDATAGDELALALRQRLGDALDAHDDPRGILLFPDVCEFRGRSYDAIVREVEAAGCWAPNVRADHVPVRYASAAGGHDALVGEMIKKMGRDAATQFDLMAQVNQNLIVTRATPDAAETARAHLETLARSMGAPFVERYSKSVEEKVRRDVADQQGRFAGMSRIQDRIARGEPLVSQAELGGFLESGGADGLLGALDPKKRAALERELGGIDAESLPDDDLGKQLSRALKRSKRSSPPKRRR